MASASNVLGVTTVSGADRGFTLGSLHAMDVLREGT